MKKSMTSSTILIMTFFISHPNPFIPHQKETTQTQGINLMNSTTPMIPPSQQAPNFLPPLSPPQSQPQQQPLNPLEMTKPNLTLPSIINTPTNPYHYQITLNLSTSRPPPLRPHRHRPQHLPFLHLHPMKPPMTSPIITITTIMKQKLAYYNYQQKKQTQTMTSLPPP